MRLRIVLGFTVVGLFVASPALAGTFPDLPGMGVAEKRLQSEPTHSEGAEAADAPSQSSAPTTDAVLDEAVSAEQVKPVLDMPGGGSLPILGEVGLTSRRSESDPMPRGLTALAAIGTLVSVGGFFLFRRVLAP